MDAEGDWEGGAERGSNLGVKGKGCA